MQRQKLVACEGAALFGESHLLVGGEEILKGGHEKPHASIFTKACVAAAADHPEGAPIACAEAIHVGDSLKSDIQGGINAGLAATVWINAAGKPPLPAAAGTPQPTFTCALVTELEAIIREHFQTPKPL